MNIARRNILLSLVAVVEGTTGLGLLVLPATLFALLFGARQVAPEAQLFGRFAGAALLGVATASWGSRKDDQMQARLGLLIGLTIYNGLATALFAYAAIVLDMTGILLWPAALFHAALVPWCLVCAWRAAQQR